MIYITIAICSLLSTIQALVCPAGTEQIGGLNADIGGCGIEGCDARYQNKYQSIQDCADECALRPECASFTWAPMNGDRNHPGKTACTLYDHNTPNQVWGPSQIMCRPLRCPSGSHQIGGLNTDIAGCGLQSCDARYDLSTIEQCQTRCANDGRCVSFSWAALGGDKNHRDKKVCTVYNTIVPNQVWGPNQIICKKTVAVLTQGRPAVITGDPHFITWNGVTHHFQGAVNGPQQQFYLSTSCDTNDRVNQPFSVLGEFRQWFPTTPVTVLNYITIALYDGDETFYLYGSTAPNGNRYGKKSNGVTTIYNPSDNLQAYNPHVRTVLSDMFTIKYIPDINQFWIVIYIDDDKDITTPACVINIYMRLEWQDPAWGDYRMHYFEMAVPECYRETTCGLLGDFQTAWGVPSVITCDGGRKDIHGAQSFYPSQAEGYDASGWRWQKAAVDDHCTASPQVIEGTKPTCSDNIKALAIVGCQDARDQARQCCHIIGGNYCNDLQADCEDDVCVIGESQQDRLDEIVNIEFTVAVVEECQNNPGAFGPVPFLLYEFDGDFEETISGKDERYTLQARGDARVGDGVLYCDGNNDFVYNKESLDFGFESHSLEVLVQINDLNSQGGGLIALDSHYGDGPNGGYNHVQFDSIVYNEIGNQKKTILGSDYFRRTDQNGDRSRNTPLTEYVASNYVSETNANEFLHFVAVYDVEQNRAKLYRNNVIQLDYDPGSFMTRGPDEGVRAMFCQRHLNAGGNDFNGLIRYGAVYNFALSSADVNMLFHAKINNDFEHPIEVIGEELRPGKTLQRRQALVSNDGRSIIRMQLDNNLCVYRLTNPGFQFQWGTMTHETSAEYLRYNEDGSVALYDINGGLVQELAPANGDPGRLIIQNDLNFVAYSGSGVQYFDSHGHTAAKSGFFNFDFVNDTIGKIGNASYTFTYLMYIIGFLLTLNIVCLTISCYKRGGKNKYKIVSIESTDADTDAENQILVN